MEGNSAEREGKWRNDRKKVGKKTKENRCKQGENGGKWRNARKKVGKKQ